MISTVWIKVILLFTLLLSTFVFSVLPLKVISFIRKPGVNRIRRRQLKSALSLMSCFAAGVFMATCLLDLFPGVRDKLTEGFVAVDLQSSFPFGEFLLVFGFFIIFIIEQLILTFKENNPDAELSPLLGNMDSISVGSSYHDEHRSESYGSFSRENSQLDPQEEIEEVEDDAGAYVDPSSHSIIRSLILLCALSLHSFFEGLAIGLQQSTSDVLEIFLPVALHKSIIAFALGLNFVQSNMHVKGILKSDIVFAVTSPIGIGIGTAIVDIAKGSKVTALINGILEGIACGTFLFVVFFEILPHEFMRKRKYPNRLLKTLFLILGFCTVVLIMFIHPEDRPVCAKLVSPST